MHKLIGCFFGLASFLMFAALTMKKEGRQSDASKGVEWLVMLCWFVIMITQLFCTTVLKGKWRHHMLAEIPDEEENTVLSTNSRMQIAPVYTYLLSTFALLEIVLATTFIIEGPWWYDILTSSFPISTLAICVCYLSRPRSSTFIENLVYFSLPLHLSLQLAGCKIHDVMEDKQFNLVGNILIWTLCYPIFRKGRRLLSELPDGILATHTGKVIWGESIASALPVLYISLSSISCVTGQSNLGDCEGVVETGTIICFHIVCYACTNSFL